MSVDAVCTTDLSSFFSGRHRYELTSRGKWTQQATNHLVFIGKGLTNDNMRPLLEQGNAPLATPLPDLFAVRIRFSCTSTASPVTTFFRFFSYTQQKDLELVREYFRESPYYELATEEEIAAAMALFTRKESERDPAYVKQHIEKTSQSVIYFVLNGMLTLCHEVSL